MFLNYQQFFVALGAFGIAAYAVSVVLFLLCSRGALRNRAPRDPSLLAQRKNWPGVSVLKPCAGVDDDLDHCLESYCAIAYPNYQIIFGVSEDSDPAHAIIQRVAERHPELDIVIAISGRGQHRNPKVSNLDGMSAHIRHPLVWIGDSNTRVHPDTLASMVWQIEQLGVGCVFSPIVGDGEQTLGSAVDTLHLSTYVAKWTYIVHRLEGSVVAPGKSWLVRKATLEAIGGWRELGQYIAEDFILLKRIRAMKLKLQLGRYPVTDVRVHGTIGEFLRRHLRWLQIRWRVTPVTTLLEPLATPVVTGSLALLFAPSRATAALFVVSLAAQFAGDLTVLLRLRGHPIELRLLPAVWLAPLLHHWLWWRSIFDRRLHWQGSNFWMGPNSAVITESRGGRDSARGAKC